jgi:hypothetical protein
MTIVSTDYRPKRSRKRKKSPAIPAAIVSPAPLRKRLKGPEVRIAEAKATAISVPRIVTASQKRMTRFGPVQEIDAEDHQRRGDAAVELFREIARRARGDAGT